MSKDELRALADLFQAANNDAPGTHELRSCFQDRVHELEAEVERLKCTLTLLENIVPQDYEKAMETAAALGTQSAIDSDLPEGAKEAT